MMGIDNPHEDVLSVFAHSAGMVEPHPPAGRPNHAGVVRRFRSHTLLPAVPHRERHTPPYATTHEVRVTPDPQ